MLSRSHSGLAACLATVLLFILLLLLCTTPILTTHPSTLFSGGLSSPPPPPIPLHIFQAWPSTPSFPSPPPTGLQRLSQTWPNRNPGHRYTLLNTTTSLSLIRGHFSPGVSTRRRRRRRPDLVRLAAAAADADQPVLLSDLTRYLALLAEGGVYSDLDTECMRSVELWPRIRDAGLVVGVEYDRALSGGVDAVGGITTPVQFVQWTIAARKGHPVLAGVVERVKDAMERHLDEHGGRVVLGSSAEVLDLTGPRIFTAAVIDGISRQLGRNVSYDEFSNLWEPKLFGDVLVLPVNAFGSGQPHSGSGSYGNEQELVHHSFAGQWRKQFVKTPGGTGFV